MSEMGSLYSPSKIPPTGLNLCMSDLESQYNHNPSFLFMVIHYSAIIEFF